MESEAQRLAGEMLHGASDVALGACSADSELAAKVGSMVARELGGWVSASPADRAWPSAQQAVLQLGSLPGVDEPELAEALIGCCARDHLWGNFSPLLPSVFGWMMRWAADAVYAAVEAAPTPGVRFLEAGLFTHHDDRAIAWMIERLLREYTSMSFLFQDMRVGALRSVWDGAQWSARLDAMCETWVSPVRAAVDERPRDLLLFGTLGMGGPAPIESSAAQVRLACTYSSVPTHVVAYTVIGSLRGYRSGDPLRDVDLFWWSPTLEQAEMLRSILEFSGPPGERGEIVDAASERGLIDDGLAAFLAEEIARPRWVDGDMSWKVERVVEAGSVRLPDGRLAVSDPVWVEGYLPFVEQLSPGRYPVEVTVAIHALGGRQCAAAQLIVDRAAAVERWEPVFMGQGLTYGPGYRVEIGLGSFGAAAALLEGAAHGHTDDLHKPGPGWKEIDHPEHGGIVAFTVGPQHQFCRTWRGLDSHGRVVRLYTDLGLLDHDPAGRPIAETPMDRGTEQRHQEEAAYEPPALTPDMTAREAGIPQRVYLFRANHGSPHGGGIVRAHEHLDPADSWADEELIWFSRQDTKIGQALPTREFLTHFTPISPRDAEPNTA
jgi:hypothetical protein